MYGWRNLRVDGIFCGSIESNVAKIGVVWRGRNESTRHDVLFSWTLLTYGELATVVYMCAKHTKYFSFD